MRFLHPIGIASDACNDDAASTKEKSSIGREQNTYGFRIQDKEAEMAETRKIKSRCTFDGESYTIHITSQSKSICLHVH